MIEFQIYKFVLTLILDLQKTMGVMQKFREEELHYRRERLEAENAELQKMLESSPRFRDQ